MLDYEKKFECKMIAGVDEAGRGPLAGPVVCAAVIMPMDKKNIIDGINDSKKLTEKKREALYEQIKAKAGANKKWVSVDSDYVFKGTFDGQGHSISGVYISTAYSYVSMFGGVAGNAKIKNFVLENSYLVESKNSYFGTIIGRINDASANVSLTDITLADTVLLEEGANGINYVGGFVGLLEKGKLTLSNCHFNGKVNFPNGEHIAGFVGKASGGTNIVFNNCHGSGQVIAKDFVAGLSVYTDSTTKKNNGSCLTGSIFCISGSNKNASYIK